MKTFAAPMPSERPSHFALQVLDAFEVAWRGQHPPDIAAFWHRTLAEGRCPDHAGRPALLIELIALDLQFRHRGTPAARHELPPLRVEDYAALFPELGPAERLPSDLITEEYRIRRLWGDSPAHEDYADRFSQRWPQLQAELIRIDAADQRLNGHATPAGPPTRPDHPDVDILGELGRGAMGVVYKARQEKPQRLVALKTIQAGVFAGGDERTRFYAEANAAARLQHPNIVQIHGMGERQGQPYLLLEFMEGGNLAAKLAGRPQAPNDAARLVETLAWAVHHAHQRGVVHRDLKPANVLLTADGIPKIADFGLAKLLQSTGTGLQTQSGAVLGTPSYMAPEQAAGKNRDVGPAADVHALGAILYELLTGRPPFRGETVLDTLELVRNQEAVTLRRLNPRLPRDLETICLKCLQKDPGKRYLTALALAEDLRRFLDREPIRARPVGAAERAWKWARRRPMVAALLATILLVAGLGLGGMVWQWRQTVAALAEARKAERATETNLYFSQVALADREWYADRAGRAEEALDQCPMDHRGWEWYYLKRRCRAVQIAWQEPRHQHEEVTVDATGRWVAWTYGNLSVCGPNGERRVIPLPKDITRIDHLTLSPGGRYLACAVNQDSVLVWEPQTDSPIRYLRGHTGEVQCLEFSPDGERLASGGLDKTARLWELQTGRQIRCFTGSSQTLRVLAFSHDGRRLAAGTGESSAGPHPVHLWDVETGRVVQTIPASPHWNSCLTFSPDDTLLACGTYVRDDRDDDRALLTIWDVRTGKEKDRVPNPSNHVQHAAFSPDGRHLAWLAGARTVRLWDVARREEVRRYPLPANAGRFVFPDCQNLVLVCNDYLVRSLDPTQDAGCQTYRGHRYAASSVTFTPDGTFLASGSGDQTVKLWNVETGEMAATLDHPGSQRWVRAVAVTRDADLLASGCWDGSVVVWGLANREKIVSVRAHQGRVLAVAFSPDGHFIASGGQDKALVVWEADTGREFRRFAGHEAEVTGVAFHPGGSLLASTSVDRTVRVWDLHTGRQLLCRAGENEMTSIAFSPAGNQFATGLGGAGATAILWDTATGDRLQTYEGHESKLTGVAFSPDGRRLATSSNDRTVKVWETDTGREVLTLQGHKGGVNGVAFSPDGQRLASVGWEGTVRVWDGRP